MLITTNLHNTLVARGEDDRVIFCVIGDRVHVRPVAAWPYTQRVAERCIWFQFCLLSCMGKVNVNANCTCIQRAEQCIAFRIEDLGQIPYIDNATRFIDLEDMVTNGGDVYAVIATIVTLTYAQQYRAIWRLNGLMSGVSKSAR